MIGVKSGKKLHEGHIQAGLAAFINYRKHLIVPNVSWGWGLTHEADLIVVRSRMATEIEIKLTLADLKADLKKQHSHNSKKISKLVYCVWEDHVDFVKNNFDAKVGIIAFSKITNENVDYIRFKWIRPGRSKRIYLSLDDEFSLLRLAAMRVWNLKLKLYGLN